MQCREFREIADSYLSSELIVETNHLVISHLERCAECRHELAARREVRSRLRQAFTHAPENQMRPEFAYNLSTQLREYALGKRSAPVESPRGWRSSVSLRRASWLALAACLLLAVGFGLVLLRQRMFEWSRQPETTEVAAALPSNPPDPNSGIPDEIVRTELARNATGDHRDCAVRFRLSEKPIDLTVAGQMYDPAYINLTKAVMSQQGDIAMGAQFVEAHSCVFQGRRFAHIVLRYHDRLVSLLVTDHGRRKEGQSSIARRIPTVPEVMACSQFDGYQVSCFETTRRAIFVVSDLPEGENLTLARALAPSVFAHITHTENGA